ncbi:hypothetical protein SH1V18_37080 [Vallitalea longa]|uniref:Tail specific protease domain-containing protein n=1 Tax=Vallitalea longa TaxID=2936439 RepID=A0A9W5YHE1_9FIRM|nr:S41 family peptidase [Vallitalea longa]GKX31228.1 hypothetical protein SH1V18_37080 [Vallitalea longa]
MKIGEIKYIILLVVVVIFLLIGCENTINQDIESSLDTISQDEISDDVDLWIEDIRYLQENLESKHKNMYHTISKEEFSKEVESLINDLPKLTDTGTIMRIKSLVAKIGDGHTAVCENINFRFFPLKFIVFDDGIYVINTIEEYKDILGTKLIKIGNEPIDDIINKMGEMVSSDNKIQLLNNTLNHIIIADYLKEYGYIGDINKGKFVFQDIDDKEISIEMNSIYNANAEKWLAVVNKYSKVANLSYVKNTKEPYWYEYLGDEKLIYFQYNSCMNNNQKPIKTLVQELSEFIEENDVEKFVFDMRNNGGGDSRIIKPLINYLAKNNELNKKDNLFVVIGASTFSSAILNTEEMQSETNATIIGTPTGGRPNHYGEVKTFTLPNNGITIKYSTKYFNASKNDDDSIYPDITVENTFRDFIDGIDTVMEEILSK